VTGSSGSEGATNFSALGHRVKEESIWISFTDFSVQEPESDMSQNRSCITNGRTKPVASSVIQCMATVWALAVPFGYDKAIPTV